MLLLRWKTRPRDTGTLKINDRDAAETILDHKYCQRWLWRNLSHNTRTGSCCQAVDGSVLAVDLIKDPNQRYLVNEINHTMEFHTTISLTCIDLPGLPADDIVDVALSLKIYPHQLLCLIQKLKAGRS